jgi:ubiquinone/menaquinone biosynthesis C-methylase UbiE
MENTNTAIATFNQTYQAPRFSEKISDCLMVAKNKTRDDWTVEQLGIQPYQHILEIGFNNGTVLEKVAKKLQSGFVAGVDESVDNYLQAAKRNKKFINNEMMQLHIGKIADLPYPNYYFDTIYGNNVCTNWKEPENQFIQLTNLLKSGGKLIMVFQPRWATTEKLIWEAAENIQDQFAEAGLTDTRLAFREMSPVTCITATGFKA